MDDLLEISLKCLCDWRVRHHDPDTGRNRGVLRETALFWMELSYGRGLDALSVFRMRIRFPAPCRYPLEP